MAAVQRRDAWAAMTTFYAIAVYLFLYVPIFILAVFSFNDGNGVVPPFRGFSTRWYLEVWNDRLLQKALGNSIMLGLATAVISSVLGTLLAFGFRRRFAGKDLLLTLTLMPMLAPGIIMATGLLLTWIYIGVSPSLMGSTLIAHVTYTLPFVFLVVFPRLHKFDRSLEEASMDLGAGPIVTFLTVTGPIIMPGIIASALFAFTLSFDEFILSFFLVGNSTTLPIYLWGMLLNHLTPEVNAIGLLILVFSVVLTFAGNALLELRKAPTVRR
jgi:ABC-type spermidine/putrescine transport system permease subunit II